MPEPIRIPEGLFIPFSEHATGDAQHPVLFGYTGTDFLAYCDRDLRVLWANRSVIDMLGYTEGLPVGATCHELFCGCRAPCPDCAAREVLAGASPASWERRLSDGRIIAVTAYPGFAGGEEPVGVLITGSDITGSREAEAALARSNDTVRSLFTAAPVGIGVAKDRVLVHVNEKLQRMTGYSEEELIGRSVELLYDSQQEYRAVGEYKYRRLSEFGVCSLETRFRTRAGDAMDVFMRSAALDRNDLDAGVIFTVLDITDQKRTQAQLERTLSQKETLLREVHHRSKNNMQIISSLLNLESERVGRAEVTRPLQKMRARIRSMALVHEKLYQSENLERVDLGEYAEKLSGELVSLHGAPLQRTVRSEAVSVDIDFAVPFGLILNELITNSLQHGFAPGERGEITITIARRAQHLVLTLRDSGRGVPPEFEMHATSSLGLKLVSALVEQLHGSITVRNDGGTEWTVKLLELDSRKG
jgi:PAS domain S-box-containing protein